MTQTNEEVEMSKSGVESPLCGAVVPRSLILYNF